MKKIIFVCLLLSGSSLFLSAQTLENRILSYTNRCIFTADINGDGYLDLVSGGLYNLQWHKNTGNGVFRNYLITANYADIRAVHACDLDEDGDMDILVSSFTNNRVLWMRNNGNQIFDEVILTSTAGGTEYLDVADIDNDGDLDILGAAFNSDIVYLLTNDGNENFAQTTIATGLDGAISVKAADLDNDGDMDVAAAAFNNNTIVWIENTGSGTFVTHTLSSSINGPVSLQVSDLDNDNDADLIYTSNGGYGWFTNSPGGLGQIVLSSYAIREICIVDLNNDSHKDIVIADYNEDDIIWSQNNGYQNFGYGGIIDFSVDYASMIVSGDFNNDGFTDIISGGSYDIKIHLNNASQTFTTAQVDRALYTALASCAGDFDNDGDTDIMGGGYLNLNFIRNDGNGLFTTSKVLPSNISMAIIDMHAADLDGDGDTDVVFSADAYGFTGLNWIENQGGGTFERRIIYGLADAEAIYPVDFDFDGDMDVVASSMDGSYVYWFENNGDEVFTQHLISGNYWYPMDVCAFDYDQDGLMDVVAAYSGNSDKIVIHRNTGSGFTNWAINSSAPGANSVAVIDMDLDGDLDCLSSSFEDNKIAWYENPNFTQHIITTSAIGATHVDAGDFDGDGDIDVCSSSISDDKVCWYRNGGTMNFTRITLSDKVPYPTHVSVGDVTGDGVDDILSTCKESYTVAMYGIPQAGPPIALTDCGQLFISEYIEGSSNNKVIEIFNPTLSAVNLSGYEIQVFQNGSLFPTQTAILTGTLASMDVHVVAHSSSNASILAIADQTFGFGFNGNDAVALVHNGDILDIIGKIGFDPGTQWSSGGVSTLDMTLVRKNNIAKGSNINPVTFNPAVEWNALPQDNITNLGAHTSLCASYCPPSVSITTSQNQVCSGTAVTFTAIPVNQGTTPVYQWKKNGNNMGNNAPVFTTSSLANNDVITCTMTSSEACAITPTVNSNSITMSVTQSLTPSVSITTPTTSFCQGTSVTFTAVPANGGTSPAYQWKVNGANISGAINAQYTTNSLANNDVVTCVMTSNLVCLTAPSATANAITVSVTANLTPSVTISASQTTICAGSSVTFTAIPVNGGSNPAYQWKRNGTTVTGATSSTYTTSTLVNGETVSCQITSNATCLTTPIANSANIVISVTPTITASVSITANANSICAGETITFTASPVNGGITPSYQWKKNGNAVSGATGPVFIANNLTNNDIINCEMTSNANCAVPAVAVSNLITISVSQPATPTISIAASQTTICIGTTVTFSATSGNGGNNPLYQWYKNGIPVNGETQAIYITNELLNSDQIYCTLVSNASCITTPNAISNTLTITISSAVSPEVSIVASQNPVCEGSLVIFTAVPLNGGPSPIWQWKVNGENVNGAYSPVFATSDLNNGDEVVCEMISDANCLTTPYATSNTIVMGIQPIPVPVAYVQGVLLSTTQPFNAYQWLFEGSIIPGAIYQQHTATANGSYRVEVSDNNGCLGVSAPVQVVSVDNQYITTDQAITLRPNPNSGIFYMDVFVSSPVTVDLKIINSLGIEIPLPKALLKQGQNSIPFNLSQLAAGLYSVAIILPDGIRTIKFVKE